MCSRNGPRLSRIVRETLVKEGKEAEITSGTEALTVNREAMIGVATNQEEVAMTEAVSSREEVAIHHKAAKMMAMAKVDMVVTTSHKANVGMNLKSITNKVTAIVRNSTTIAPRNQKDGTAKAVL